MKGCSPPLGYILQLTIVGLVSTNAIGVPGFLSGLPQLICYKKYSYLHIFDMG